MSADSTEAVSTELVALPNDPLTIEARLERIEAMLAEIHADYQVIKPAVMQVTAEAANKGVAGLMGVMMGGMGRRG